MWHTRFSPGTGQYEEISVDQALQIQEEDREVDCVRYESTIQAAFKVTSVSGDEFLCHCPWHNDTSQGHLYVNGVKGLYLCMSCGAKGALDGLSNIPRNVVGSDDERDKVKRYRAPKQAPTYYPQSWLQQFSAPTTYWSEDRQLSPDVIDLFGLGYDPFTNRATLPLRDVRGRVLGVCYRRLDGGTPKYLNPKGYPLGRHLYGGWLLADQWTVALVEGQMDAIRGWASGVPALALQGARITPDQIKVLQRAGVRRAHLMLDNDKAGTKGTVQVYEALKQSGIIVRVGWYRDYWLVKDPDQLAPAQYRKMFHSAGTVFEWAKRMGF